MGTTPSVETSPTVGLMPTQPLKAAGQEIDPSVSVPIANGGMPAATAAPLPELDPPADLFIAYGLRVRPPYALQPDAELSSRMLAHSLRFALPITTIPAWRRRVTRAASRLGFGCSARASEPAVVGRSAVSMLSFTRTGRPCRGPRGAWSSRCSSRWRAVSSAASLRVHTDLI